MLKVAPTATLRLKTVTTMPTIEENEKYFVESTTINFNQMVQAPNVGGSKSSKKGKEVLDQPTILLATTDPEMFSKRQQDALYESGMMNHLLERHAHDLANDSVPKVPSTPEHVNKFNSPTKLRAFYDAQRKTRDKANKEQSEEQIEDELEVHHPQRRTWN